MLSTVYSLGVLAKCSLEPQVHRQGLWLFLSALGLSFDGGACMCEEISLNPPRLRSPRLRSV